jgi:sulfur-carrier protein
MAVVFIPPGLRELTGGMAQVAASGSSVGAVIDALDSQFPGIKARLCRGDSLAPGVQVSVGSTITTHGLRADVEPDSEVHFLPAIGGG